MANTEYAGEYGYLALHFIDEWADRTPIAWGNKTFSPPTVPEFWVRFTILNSTASRATIGTPGTNRAVYPGRVVVQVFAPRDFGELELREHADAVADIFRNIKLENFRFKLPSIVAVDSIAGDLWTQINVDCPFQRDEYHG